MIRFPVLLALLLGLAVHESNAQCTNGACGVSIRQRVRVVQRPRLVRAPVVRTTRIEPVAACQCGPGCQCAGTQGGICNCATPRRQVVKRAYRRVVCVGGRCFVQ